MAEFGPYRSGASVTFQNDVNQRLAPLADDIQFRRQEEMYQRRLREQQRRENSNFLREVYDLNPEVVPPHYQQMISDEVQKAVFPLGRQAYSGDAVPSEGSVQKLYGSINEVRKKAGIVNSFYQRTAELRKAIESDKTGFIDKGYAEQKLKNLWVNGDGSWKTPEQLADAFTDLETFMEDDAMKNVGAMFDSYSDTKQRKYYYTKDTPTKFGKYRSQDIEASFNDLYELDDSGKPRYVNGNLVPKASEEVLADIKFENPDLYEAILFRAEEKGVKPIDFLSDMITLRGGGVEEKIMRSSTISDSKANDTTGRYGIDPDEVMSTENRVDFIHDVVTGTDPSGASSINGVNYSGEEFSGEIISVRSEDQMGPMPTGVEPSKNQFFVIKYRDKYGQVGEVRIDTSTPDGRERAGQLFNNILSKDLKGTKGQVYPENFRKVWKQKYSASQQSGSRASAFNPEDLN